MSPQKEERGEKRGTKRERKVSHSYISWDDRPLNRIILIQINSSIKLGSWELREGGVGDFQWSSVLLRAIKNENMQGFFNHLFSGMRVIFAKNITLVGAEEAAYL